jgi:hypothetical protein
VKVPPKPGRLAPSSRSDHAEAELRDQAAGGGGESAAEAEQAGQAERLGVFVVDVEVGRAGVALLVVVLVHQQRRRAPPAGAAGRRGPFSAASGARRKGIAVEVALGGCERSIDHDLAPAVIVVVAGAEP